MLPCENINIFLLIFLLREWARTNTPAISFAKHRNKKNVGCIKSIRKNNKVNIMSYILNYSPMKLGIFQVKNVSKKREVNRGLDK